MTWRPSIKLRLRWCILKYFFIKMIYFSKLFLILICFKNIKNNNFTKKLEGIQF